MSEEILQWIKGLLAEDARDFIPLERTTRLEADLKMYGDDAVDFLMAYSKRFNVDVSNFMAADYFSGEGEDDVIGTVLCWLFKVEILKSELKKELTIGDLEKGAIAGRLDEQVINANI